MAAVGVVAAAATVANVTEVNVSVVDSALCVSVGCSADVLWLAPAGAAAVAVAVAR